MTSTELVVWAPIVSFGGAVIVALIALGGVVWANRRGDIREREKHRRERLVDALGELLSAAALASQQALHISELPDSTDESDPAVVAGQRDLAALLTTAEMARHKIEFVEPRLEDLAAEVITQCLLLGNAAWSGKLSDWREYLPLQQDQAAATQELIKAYRALS